MAEVAGYLANLQRGFQELGHTCHYLDLPEHPFDYEGQRSMPRLSRWSHLAHRRLGVHRRRSIRWYAWLAMSWPPDLCIFAWAVFHADLFIFAGRNSLLLRNLDLPILKALGKHVVWVFLGSDHRPPYLNGKVVREARTAGDDGYRGLVTRARAMRETVRRVERHANAVVASSASAQFHARSFVHHLAVGIPCGGPDEESAAAARHEPIFTGHGVRILHAPSDPAKGTEAIRGCLEQLRQAGIPFDYVEITGRPNRDVRAAIVESELVVDEVYSDTPLAALGTEAAYLGRAVLVGGYYADQIHSEIAPELVPPGCFVTPQRFCAALQELVSDKGRRRQIGTLAQSFVRERWSRADVARRYLQIAAGEIPAEWICDPEDLRYVQGWGLDEHQLRDVLHALVGRWRAPALAMDHNPALEARLLELSR
jgi:hypothetical protein